MIEELIKQLILLKPFIIVSAVGTLLIVIVSLIYCRKFSWQRKNIGMIGFLYEMDMSETVILAVCLLKLYLVFSLLFTDGRIEMVHICFYGALVLIYNLCRHRLKDMFISVFNGGVIMGVLFVANLLLAYLREVLFDMKIAVALGLLAFFLIVYALYDVAQCILAVVETRPDPAKVAAKQQKKTRKRQRKEDRKRKKEQKQAAKAEKQRAKEDKKASKSEKRRQA